MNKQGMNRFSCHDTQERLVIAECCGGNTQGSGASGSDTEPLNNFIDRFCSLQLTGHTTPVYFLTAATMEGLQKINKILLPFTDK